MVRLGCGRGGHDELLCDGTSCAPQQCNLLNLPSRLLLSMQVKRVRCEASGVLVPKDKAVKRFIVRNIVDASAIRDIQDASVLEGMLPGVSIGATPVLLRSSQSHGLLAKV